MITFTKSNQQRNKELGVCYLSPHKKTLSKEGVHDFSKAIFLRKSKIYGKKILLWVNNP